MASKTSKKANAAAKKGNHAPVEKDDGTRWIVVDAKGSQVYPGTGILRGQAERLATGLVQPATIRQVA